MLLARGLVGLGLEGRVRGDAVKVNGPRRIDLSSYHRYEKELRRAVNLSERCVKT